MPKDMGNVPFHMRDDSDDWEDDFVAVEAESEEGISGGGGPSKTAEGGNMGGRLSKEEKKKVKVGEVTLDPEIDYANFSKDGPGLASKAALTDDGTINIWVNLKDKLPDLPQQYAISVDELGVDREHAKDCPPLNIVIFIVGSRGDVQPYLSLALKMIESNGHRIRIATHPDFRDFILEGNKHLAGKTLNGVRLEGKLEFWDAGGDPKALMSYMVKNPGLMPGWETLKSGDVGLKRKMTGELLDGFYTSVFSPDPVSGKPFAADAILSNPPAFAHVHIAEALGIPLHMTFTMPWTASAKFCHPLVNVQSSNAEQRLTNIFSFALADMLTWQGLGDVLNSFRTATLGLEPLTARSGPSVLDRLKIPWTFCWSESLIEKPDDWKEHIDISGFYFLEGDTDYQPDPALKAFLSKGDPPIYIGFGSVVVEDAAAMTQTIFDAVEEAGVRALVSAGWGGLGGTDVPENVFILKGNIPHDWLFANGRVSAVCHHGGAGTTAIGLRNGLPTIVVPFFGDQKFWGNMIHRAGAGPEPIPQKQLSVEKLADAIRFATGEGAKKAAGVMGEKIRNESGEQKGANSFHAHLPLQYMRCDVTPSRIAHWWSPDLLLRMSGAVAGVLHEAGKVKMEDLQPLRSREYQSRWRSGDPISAGASGLFLMISNHYGGIAQMFYKPSKGLVNYTTSIPQGLADVIIGMHEGFNAIPGRLGGDVRQRGQVDDFGSGLREGGKGLFYGWWDGITGLATEPYKGAKKEGVAGFMKGAGRSWVNVTAKPAAGVLGVMALPLHGGWKALRRKIAGAPQRKLIEPRMALSKSDAAELSETQKKEILARYDVLLKETPKRRVAQKKDLDLFLKNAEKAKQQEESGRENDNEV